MMKRFGYYITESSEHNAEYMPYFIKDKYPELIERFNIPLDEYPRRCIHQIDDWNKRRDELTHDPHLSHTRTSEYASYIMEAMETNVPYKIGGNVLNTRPDHEPPAKRRGGGALPGGRKRRAAHGDRRPARAVRGAEPHQHQRAAADALRPRAPAAGKTSTTPR